jgi:hypothetical protein
MLDRACPPAIEEALRRCPPNMPAYAVSTA